MSGPDAAGEVERSLNVGDIRWIGFVTREGKIARADFCQCSWALRW